MITLGLESVTSGVVNSVVSLGQSIGNMFDNLGGLISLGLDSVTSGLSSAISSLGESVTLLFDELLDGITDLFDNLVDSFRNILIELFVPTSNVGDDISTKIYDKFPFIFQIGNVVATLFELDGSTEPPDLTITYYGSTVKIIDFTLVEDYIPLMQTIIVGLAWGSFIIRLYKRIPRLIGGFS